MHLSYPYSMNGFGHGTYYTRYVILGVRRTSAITETQKRSMQSKKESIQGEFKNRMELLIDKPKH